MDATAWMALGSIVAVLALGATLTLHVIRYAYQRGVADQRLAAAEAQLRTLESKIDAGQALAATVEGLKSTVAALQGSVDRFDSVLLDLPTRMAEIAAQSTRASRARKAAA